MEDMKDALDKAATSPDPAVRNMALRYREMQQEFDQYAAFFTIYKTGITVNGTATHVRPAGRTAPANASAARERVALPRTRPRTDKIDVFSTDLRDLLLEINRPLRLNEIYTTYRQRRPEDEVSIETFRQRLVKRKQQGMVSLIPQRGYWWAEAPLTESPVPEDGGQDDE